MSSADMRKHTRYKAKKPIRFSDNITEGVMVDASREGALIVIEGQPKKIGSYITFSVYLDGTLPPKKVTTPEIALNKIFSKQNQKLTQPSNTSEVKIAAKVVRHADYKDKYKAMGLQFMDMNADHLMRWLSFLGEARKNQEILPFGTSNVSNRKQVKKSPGFTIRFQDMRYIKDFLPAEPTGSFFIPTKKESKKDEKVRLTLVHPSQERYLQVEGVVRTYCNSKVDNSPQDGLLCSFASLNASLIKRINNFLEEKFYTDE